MNKHGGNRKFGSKEELKKRVKEPRHKGLKQGDHFSVHRGRLYIFDIPKSKWDRTCELDREGMSVEDIAEEINEKVEDLKRWYER